MTPTALPASAGHFNFFQTLEKTQENFQALEN